LFFFLAKNSKDLKDLALHLSYVLQDAGLRLCAQANILKTDKNASFSSKLFDRIGIPYSLIIEDETLKSGLLKLRNRDTSLEETIHITDIPNYLLNIFK